MLEEDMILESLSARRAWIEIALAPKQNATEQSLSARRAWIEMTNKISESQCTQVALRKESVDRNRRADERRIYS